MSSFDINGVKVTFPFEPYDIQKNYMKKVIEALQNSSNAVLESPTGTGKTLSLLCSSLAWLMNEKMKFNISRSQRFTEDVDGTDTATSLGILNWRLPKIIYSSRTHSQLSQVMQELKQTIYKDVVRSAIIGSREQLCLKQEVLNEPSNSNQINLCRHLVKSRGCSYHFGVEKHKGFFTAETRVIDIEDLMKSGKRQHFCPYYMAREIKQEADITFMPYNYILDSSLRQINGIYRYPGGNIPLSVI